MCWHKWSKWGEIEEVVYFSPIGQVYGAEVWQKKICQKCGKIKMRRVRD